MAPGLAETSWGCRVRGLELSPVGAELSPESVSESYSEVCAPALPSATPSTLRAVQMWPL